MVDWASITWFCAGILSSGTVVDRFLLLRQKKAVYSALVSFWNRLDESVIPDLPKRVIESGYRLCRSLGGRWSAIALSVLLSVVLTLIAQLGGEYLEGQRHLLFYDFYVFLLNAGLDLLAIGLTLYVLGVMRRSSPLLAIPLIVLNVLAILVLSVFFLVGCEWSRAFRVRMGFPHEVQREQRWALDVLERHYIYNRDWLGSLYPVLVQQRQARRPIEARREPLSTSEIVRWSLLSAKAHLLGEESIAGPETTIVYRVPRHELCRLKVTLPPLTLAALLAAGTALIPVGAFLFCVAVLIWLKAVLAVARFFALHVLEVIAESYRDPKDFAPVTLFATALAAIVVFSAGLGRIVSLVLDAVHA